MENTTDAGTNRTGTDMAPVSNESSSRGGVSSGKALDLTESVAGEEDPGASIDIAPAASSRDACPRCGGSGKLAGGDCPVCQGTGKVTVGIGGA